MPKLKVIFALMLLLFANASTATDLWTQAVEASRNNDYKRAAQLFETITLQQPQNDAAYYNLGLCQYKLNNMLPALINFKKAYALNPDLLDARWNIAHTLNKIPNAPKINYPSKSENIIAGIFKVKNLNYWSAILVVVMLMLSICIFYRKKTNKNINAIFNTFLGAISLCIIMIIGTIGRMNTTKEAVVSQAATKLFSEPNLQASSSTAPIGMIIEVKSEQNNWLKVKTINNQIGWIEKSKITMIF